jgi:hypothetical protein
MGTALVAGLLGLFGTIVGGILTTWTARQTSDRTDHRAREEIRRNEHRSAVMRFVTAALAYRKAEMDRWYLLKGKIKGGGPESEEVYRTRNEMWYAFYELEMSANNPELILLARRAIDTAYSIHDTDSEVEMNGRADQIRGALSEIVTAARTHELDRSRIEDHYRV